MAREGDRRRAERHAVNVAGELCLSGGRRISVRIVNLGRLGALVQIGDLEEAVLEGERAVLVHPLVSDGATLAELGRTAGVILRVELDFATEGVSRHVAVFFDDGPPPAGCPGSLHARADEEE